MFVDNAQLGQYDLYVGGSNFVEEEVYDLC
jgi:hypothetical protein